MTLLQTPLHTVEVANIKVMSDNIFYEELFEPRTAKGVLGTGLNGDEVLLLDAFFQDVLLFFVMFLSLGHSLRCLLVREQEARIETNGNRRLERI